MRTTSASRGLIHLACAVSVAGGLGGCGGGGGGGTSEGPSSPPTLAITSANGDTVGHFAAVAALSLPISWLSDSGVSLTGGPAQGASADSSRFALLQAVRSRFSKAASRSQALAVVDLGELPCTYGGTVWANIDDVDNDGMESPGDVETVRFTNCMGSVGETYNGTMRADVVTVGTQSVTYNVTLAQLSYVTPNHSLAFNGSYVANESIGGDAVQTTTLTVAGSVSIGVATHLPYTDTVTLGDGFVVQSQIDYRTARSALSAQGRAESATAGGSVDLATSSSLTTAAMGMYPEAGVLNVRGKTGALSITARSSATVCLDADTNDDTAIEWTNTQSWEWLL